MSCPNRVCNNCSANLKGNCRETSCCEWNPPSKLLKRYCYSWYAACDNCLKAIVGGEKANIFLDQNEIAISMLNELVTHIQMRTGCSTGRIELISIPYRSDFSSYED